LSCSPAALRELDARGQCKVIAITGTNGKTTTTALTGHLCRAAGKRVGGRRQHRARRRSRP
jgi:UDP-N-acetylmuramoylalanine-D-glutamate ligase